MRPIFVDLKHLISRSGLSAPQIADITGLSPTTIYGWMEGRIKEPRMSNIRRVAKVFDQTIVLIDGQPRLAPKNNNHSGQGAEGDVDG